MNSPYDFSSKVQGSYLIALGKTIIQNSEAKIHSKYDAFYPLILQIMMENGVDKDVAEKAIPAFWENGWFV